MRRETSLATMEAAAPCSRRTGNVCAGQVSLESGVKRTSTSVPPIPASMEDCAGTWSTGSYASVMWPSLASAVSWTWLMTGSWAFSPLLAPELWPCSSSSCLLGLLLLLPPTKGRLKEPTAPAVRRRLALEWKCGSGCRPRHWKGSSRRLLLFSGQRRT
uniref:Uncharacterized protein n=1 Tax=Mus musculus TaxID=10090 RepID=Q8BM99_MOUSE|nr:unnamed protein product [Mus musculus]